MTEPLVLIADHDAVRVLTLNRPAARNALSRDLIKAAYAALTEADADESVRAVVSAPTSGPAPVDLAGVGRMVRDHQPPAVLLVPAERGDVEIVAVQDRGLARRRLRRSSEVPA